ncbi:MAG TPA: efflux RND transporter permease subunit [Candidatus Methylomirabilis sp.]|nr:efflux RND transporter permease subunit [Candidatus Methylomirabilis sp.]
MWLIRAALRRPIATLVIVIAVALCSVLAAGRMRIDIFPNLNLPVIYVAQPYGGMSPAQMEGYLVYYYEYHFLYINGIQSVEDKSIQGNGLLKLTFYPGTDMSQALAQTISYVNRARAFMPPGTVSPFVIRFDAGTVPVGYVVFSSTTRTVGEIQDLALNRVRPAFATLPGLTSPPPFGGNQRTMVITINPDRLRAYNMSPDEVAQAVNNGNILQPAGNVRTGSLLRIAQSDSVTPNIQSLADLPVRTGAGPTVYLHDIGTIQDTSDIPTGYALVNGRRAVYIPVTKRPDASTVSVVNEVKKSLPYFQSLVPDDIKVSYELDQSPYVTSALTAVVQEGLLGAALTGLMILLFLGDWRSSLIVVTTIPFALLTSVVALWLTGQTINVMTLGGLALAIGILVDEGVVLVENIDHTLQQEPGLPPARGVLNGTQKTLLPRFLALLSIVAVFVPSFLMTGIAQSLFVPLSLAVAFAMTASFLLSSSFLPVMFLWTHRQVERGHKALIAGRWHFDKLRDRWGKFLERAAPLRWPVIGAYSVIILVIVLLLGPRLGQELFPNVGATQFRLRFDAPIGTRAEDTERLVTGLLDEMRKTAGPDNVAITLGYVGTQGASYPINTVFLWTSGPHEAVINVALKPKADIDIAALEEKLRQMLSPKFPGSTLSFEPGDLVSQIMNFGAPTPVEVAVIGPSLPASRTYADRLQMEMGKIPELRDLKYELPLDYPSVDVKINRELAGQLGVTTNQVARSLSEATYSSRFTTPNYWADPNTGIAYQVQVQYPQPRITSVQDVQNIPVMPGQSQHPLIGDLAKVDLGTTIGEYDRRNGFRMLTLSANVAGQDLGRVSKEIDRAIQRSGALPRGTSVQVRGQIAPMHETFTSLASGLGLAVLAIFLLLAANYESLRLAFVVLTTAPATVCGVILMLFITRTTLNIESYMGTIMAVGVGTANAILLVTFAEQHRRGGASSIESGIQGAKERMRPILMTSAAMIAGMIPMALATEVTASLGRAVIGGLIAATLVNLTVLPFVFSIVQRRAATISASLDPGDPESRYAES